MSRHAPNAPQHETPDLTARAQACHAALLARDARFDGRFFVGVTSTGIYCRPVCRVRTPLLQHCRFFDHAAMAEAEGFRPCLRCRPELAPGLSLVDSSATLAHQAARLLDDSACCGDAIAMPAIAQRLGVSDRHLRRIFQHTHGVSPLAYLNTRRLLQAKRWLTDTDWPITQVALASGFGSTRRFQAAFAAAYRMRPEDLRRSRAPRNRAAEAHQPHALRVRLAYRPPYAIQGMRRFWAIRALTGVELVAGEGQQFHLSRSWQIPHGAQTLQGWTSAHFEASQSTVILHISESLAPVAGWLLQQHRRALDLDADPAAIDPVMARLGLPPMPGLRLPGALDGWETAARIVLGQQVSVAAARTLAGRLVQAYGPALDDDSRVALPGLTHCFPDADTVARAEASALAALGIVRQRVTALQALARAVADGDVQLEPGLPVEPTLAHLLALPGIGPWTAQLIALRVLNWPDAFPASDLGLLKAMHVREPAQAEARAEAWRPWRSYAVIRWWQSLSETPAGNAPAAPARTRQEENRDA
jgi:AraC family transcriptional regulator of adaptative response / DNA-3-methyladenine glycosylase II